MKKTKRRFQFTFRTLGLLFVLIAAALTYWLKVIEEPIKRQWQAADQIAAAISGPPGGEFFFRNVWIVEEADALPLVTNSPTPSGGAFQIGTSPSGVPSWMKWRFENGKSENITSLQIQGLPTRAAASTTLTLEQLEPIEKLTYLKTVELVGVGATDKHAELLSSMPSLEIVNLGNNQLTDAGGRSLSKLPDIGWLDLRKNPVSWRTKILFPKPLYVVIDGNSVCDFRNVKELELFAAEDDLMSRLRELVLINPTSEMLTTLKNRFDLARVRQLILRFDGNGSNVLPTEELSYWVNLNKLPYRDFQLTESVDSEFCEQLLGFLAYEECEVGLYDDSEGSELPDWWNAGGLNSVSDSNVLRLELPIKTNGIPTSGLNTIFVSGGKLTLEDVKAMPSLKHVKNWWRSKLR